MARERGEEPISIGQIDLEREDLTRRFRRLLMDASVSSEKWIEVRKLLNPYLEYVSYRISGRLPNSATSPQDTDLEQSPLLASISRLDNLPDLLNIRETAEI